MGKLNPNRKLFCHYVVEGMSQGEAYSKAFDNPNIVTCRPAAVKLMKDPAIQEYIHDLEKVRFESTKAETDAAKKELWKIALDYKESTGNRIRALDILNKMNCVYTDGNSNGDQTTNINFGEMKPDDLRKLIASGDA